VPREVEDLKEAVNQPDGESQLWSPQWQVSMVTCQCFVYDTLVFLNARSFCANSALLDSFGAATPVFSADFEECRAAAVLLHLTAFGFL